MIKTLLLIPLRDNAGQRFPRTAERQLRDRLLVFGGVTRVPHVVGYWQSGDILFRDRHHQYLVALSHWTNLPPWLDVVHWACNHFRQEATYIEVAGIPDIVHSSAPTETTK